MRADLFDIAAGLCRRGEPFVLAVVVHRDAPSSAQLGDMALVTAAGEYHGWVGGACTRPTVEREARSVLAEGKPRTIVLSPDPEAFAQPRSGVAVFPMTCHSGGSVEIVLQPVLPAPCLVVYGASPTARALAALGRTMGYTVVETAEGDAAPAPPAAAPGGGAATTRAPLFAVVAAAGEGDEEAIRAALALSPDYLGVVASSRRFSQMRETLQAGGSEAAALDRISSPAGLDIGARTPEEIALSVLAEIVERRREAEKAAEPAPLEAPPAIDPVCGMAVDVSRARHTAEHAGRTVYFCCAGCRERFLAAPESYPTTARGTA